MNALKEGIVICVCSLAELNRIGGACVIYQKYKTMPNQIFPRKRLISSGFLNLTPREAFAEATDSG